MRHHRFNMSMSLSLVSLVVSYSEETLKSMVGWLSIGVFLLFYKRVEYCWQVI